MKAASCLQSEERKRGRVVNRGEGIGHETHSRPESAPEIGCWGRASEADSAHLSPRCCIFAHTLTKTGPRVAEASTVDLASLR